MLKYTAVYAIVQPLMPMQHVHYAVLIISFCDAMTEGSDTSQISVQDSIFGKDSRFQVIARKV